MHMASLPSHSWDDDGPNISAKRYSWEDPDSDDGSSDSEFEETPRTAADELIGVLVGLLMSGTIGANIFCLICYWGWKAGLNSLKPYAMAPGKGSWEIQCVCEAATWLSQIQ